MNEALQGIADPSKVILGYIPTGSSNDLARDLGIPKEPKAALDLILRNAAPRVMDLGRLTYLDEDQPEESRLFAVSCGIGFDAAVCAEAMHSPIKDTMNRIGLGKLTYLGIALKQLITARKVSCTLTLEDTVHNNDELHAVFQRVHAHGGGTFVDVGLVGKACSVLPPRIMTAYWICAALAIFPKYWFCWLFPPLFSVNTIS